MEATVTHSLKLVMGWDVMRLPGWKGRALSLTTYWSWDEVWCWGCLTKTGCCNSLALVMGICKLWWDYQNECTVTHKLFIMKEDVMRLQENCSTVTHKLLVMGWVKVRLPSWKKGTVTDKLQVMGWGVMRLPAKEKDTVTHSLFITWGDVVWQKRRALLTSCWSWDGIWWEWCTWKHHHSLAVDHGIRDCLA